MGGIDLHVHSNASDGVYPPDVVIRKAAALGLSVIALSDHDTVDGIAPALNAVKSFPGLKVVPAIEISTETPSGEVHVLGYLLDYTSPALKESLDRFRDSRETRGRRMVEKLKTLGINISWERVREIAGSGNIGRPHVAQAMLEKGLISSIAEAFDKYLGHGKPAYVERDKMTPAEAVKLISGNGGLAVLAHPNTVHDVENLVAELKTAGLAGIEAYYKDYTRSAVNEWVKMAERYGLITTGGTDYHGLDESAEVMMGGTEVPAGCVERLYALADERAKSR